MATILRHSDTCQIKQSASGKIVEVVVQDFQEHVVLHVIVSKAVKIAMKWNGKLYEGRMASMDFVSDGPTISKTQTGSRG
jgi:hypothetical protein